MKKFFSFKFQFSNIVASMLFASFLIPGSAAATSMPVVISEVQTGDTVSLSNEFVELYNASLADVDLTDWTLEYKSATGASWTKKATLAGSIRSYGYFLLAPSGYLSADANFSAGLSGTAGHVRIKDKEGLVLDTVGWGATANAAESLPALVSAAGQSLERLPGRLLEDGGNATDNDDNSKDFVIRTSPLPQTIASTIEVPGTPSETSEEVSEDETGPVAKTYLPLMITELLPDPATPALDSRDEFIELFNPNAEDVDLDGYVLQSGSDFRDYYVLPAMIIKAGGYLTLFSAETHMSLTNNGSGVRLLDPNGSLSAQAGDYSKAETGASWSLIDGSWSWSLAATPSADNVLTELEKPAPKTGTVTSTKKTTKPKVTTTKPKSTKVAKAPTAKKTPATKTKATSKSASPLVAAVSSPSSFWLLTLAGVLTLGLIAYEFRFDLQNYYFLARRKFGSRPKDR